MKLRLEASVAEIFDRIEITERIGDLVRQGASQTTPQTIPQNFTL